jgi:hypothetical protein
MEAAGHAYAFEGLVFGEAFSDKAKDWHFFGGPFYTAFATWGK